jgi:hypothetical protein
MHYPYQKDEGTGWEPRGGEMHYPYQKDEGTGWESSKL